MGVWSGDLVACVESLLRIYGGCLFAFFFFFFVCFVVCSEVEFDVRPIFNILII